MGFLNYLIVTLLVLFVTVSTSNSDGMRNDEDVFSHPMLQYFDNKHENTLHRQKRQNDKQDDGTVVDNSKPPSQNPLEHLILNQNKHGKEAGPSLARVKRQYSDYESNSIETDDVIEGAGNSYEDNDYEGQYPYPYPVPVPIIIGGGLGGGFGRGFGRPGFGGRGFGGPGFGGRGFGGPGFGGRGFGGFGPGGFGGRGFGGRGGFGGFGGFGGRGGFGGGRGRG